VLGRTFNVKGKLGRLADVFRSSPERLEVLEERIRKGQLLERLLNSKEYRAGLSKLLDSRRQQAFTNLRRGATGTSLDELDGIEADINNAIRIGKEAQQKLTKLKGETNGRGTKKSSRATDSGS
jgi:hypothetical protein